MRGERAGKLPLLASGRDADVYSLGEDRVLRRYRDGGFPPAAEVDAMRFVARYGYPVPTLHAVDGADMVLDLVAGPTMLTAVEGGLLEVEAAARVLADLHNRLHALPERPGRLVGERILHLDLHPNNVIMSSAGPVVIDWRNAGDGPPEYDVALSAMILAHVAVTADDPRSEVIRPMLGHFLEAVDVDPVGMLDRAFARRAADFPGDAQRARLVQADALVRAGG